MKPAAAVRVLSASLLLLLSACAAEQTTKKALELKPFDFARVDVPALTAGYPRAHAVVLEREDRYRTTLNGSAPSFWWQRHETVLILDAAGERYAQVLIPIGQSKLEGMRARTISPDGKVQEVEPTQVYERVARPGTTIDGLQPVAAKVFRFPGVRAGSVLEYTFVISDWHRLLTHRNEQVSGALPIRHYHLEIEANGIVDLALHLYNGGNAPIAKKQDKARLSGSLALDLYSVPVARREPLAPPARTTEPWWSMTVTRYLPEPVQRGTVFVSVFESWESTLRPLANALYDTGGTLYRHVTLAPELGPGCAPGSRCAIERALALVQRKTELSRFADEPVVGRLEEVLASGPANNFEKALLLRRALTSAGVTAWLALVARNPERGFDVAWPQPARFDHLIVFVRPQADVKTPLFLDPSCEWCALGEIPSWLQDRDAMLLETATVHGSTAFRVQVFTIEGPEAAPGVRRDHVEAELDPATGTLRGGIDTEWRGPMGVEHRLKTRTLLPEAWHKEQEQELHRRSTTARWRGGTAVSWNKQQARAGAHLDYEVPGYAVVDGERLVVPLSFLVGWDEAVGGEADEDAPRQHEVMVGEPRRIEETLTLKLPPGGYRVVELPKGGLVLHTASSDALIQVNASAAAVTIKRVLQLRAGRWAPAEYAELAQLVRRMSALRQETVVLERVR